MTAKLARAVERPVALIAAPAGAGKTALLSSWAAAHEPAAPRRVARARPGGQLAAAFWTEVMAALRARRRRTSTASPRPVAGASTPSFPRFVAALESLPGAGRARPRRLPRGDRRGRDARPRHAARSRLRPAAPRAGHPVRPLAPAPAAAHRRPCSGRSGTPIWHSPSTETGELLGALGPATSATTICELLWERTEGWAAGLRLAALSLHDHPDPSGFIRRLRRRRSRRERLPDDRGGLPPAGRHARLPAPHRDRRAGERLARRRAHRGRRRSSAPRGARAPGRCSSTPLDDQGVWFALPPAPPGAAARRARRAACHGIGPSSTRVRDAGMASGTRCSPPFATRCSERTGSWPRTCSGGTG